MTTLRKLLRLSPAELSLVVQAALLLGAIGLGLRLLPFGRLRRLLDRLSRSGDGARRSEEHTSELQSQSNLVCRLLLEKKKKQDGMEAMHYRCIHSYACVV